MASKPKEPDETPYLPLEDSEKQQPLDYREFEELEAQAQELDHNTDELVQHDSDGVLSNTSAQSVSPTSSQSKVDKFKTAFDEVRYFAGGLVSHPYESTKHYSILRHSHGLVYYKGSYTSVALTVFADRELPCGRTFWLQRRGWTGNAGLKAGTLIGKKSAWINVTPSVEAAADQIDAYDERAWQRDIKKFVQNAPKQLRDHSARETNILRIPCDANDGYLRIVMCTTDKKVLCSGPMFRLASTSTSSSSIRGASLSTLPVEVAIKIGSSVATKAALGFIQPYTQLVTSAIKSDTSEIYQPSFLQTEAASMAQGEVENKISSANQVYTNSIGQSVQSPTLLESPSSYSSLDQPTIVGDLFGPSPPFPLKFTGVVVPSMSPSQTTLDLTTVNLSSIPSEILLRYEGIFIGWSRIESLPKSLKSSGISQDWHESLISIFPTVPTQSSSSVVQSRQCSMHIITLPSPPEPLHNSKFTVLVLAYLRPAPPPLPPRVPQDLEAERFDLTHDVTAALNSLSRETWGWAETLGRMNTAKKERTLKERYVDARGAVQKQVDRVPVQMVGVRTDSHGVRDRLVGNGGVRIPRG